MPRKPAFVAALPVLVLALASGCARHRAPPTEIPPPAPRDLTTPEADEDQDEENGTDAEPAKGATERPAKPSPGTASLPGWAKDASRKIVAHAAGKRRAWDRLAEMTDRFGHRLSGSKALEQAIDWAVATMEADGLAQARREKVMVPHWVRGNESLRIVGPVERELQMLGLGMSVGTKGKLRAPLIVVENVEAIAKAGVKGKIVLIDLAMPPFDHDEQDSGYGAAVQGRTRGASEAAKHGAKAVLIRSVTAHSLATPHTGALRYDDGVPKIPAAAVTVEGAQMLVRMARRGPVELELRMGARTLADVESGNAIAELRGREKPEEVVLIGGHIDSWDVGDGATDDGVGCIAAMEAALILHELGLVPRRTIRVVLFTNEENGLRGGLAYFAAHGKEKHVAAIESDSGSGAPRGFDVASKDPKVVAPVAAWAGLFRGLGADHIESGWGGADISPLTEAGVLSLSLRPDGSKYFDVHHSPADTVEKIDPTHLQKNAAAMALMAYVLAERE